MIQRNDRFSEASMERAVIKQQDQHKFTEKEEKQLMLARDCPSVMWVTPAE